MVNANITTDCPLCRGNLGYVEVVSEEVSVDDVTAGDDVDSTQWSSLLTLSSAVLAAASVSAIILMSLLKR